MPDILTKNITVPGFSPLYPAAHCVANGSVCQLTTGEGEINAASTISALMYSSQFNLQKTYFLVAGIAGINPHVATTGSVTFAQYAVQLDLQYEFSASQIPANDSSGYFPQNADYPDTSKAIDYPGEIYGTEAFELNKALRDQFIKLANTVKLNDSSAAAAYRATYPYAPANQPPTVVACSTGTSNVYWSGSVLGDAFSNYTSLLSNGSARYCATQQEDNASLEAFLRGHVAGKIDFARIAIMRTASDFDRAPPGETEVFHLLYADQEGFEPSIQNIFIAGNSIVTDVVSRWGTVYANGVKSGNYLGDLLNSLNSSIVPDIGVEADYIY